jgi:hypothetical protein
MPKGHPIYADRDWRLTEKKTCIRCGEDYWPGKSPDYKLWLSRRYCSSACNRLHKKEIIAAAQKSR